MNVNSKVNAKNVLNNRLSNAAPSPSDSTDIDAAKNMLKIEGFPAGNVCSKNSMGLSALDIAIKRNNSNSVIKGLIELKFDMSQVVDKKEVGVALAEKGFSKAASDIASELIKEGSYKEERQLKKEQSYEAASDIAIKLINKGFSEEAHNIASELIKEGSYKEERQLKKEQSYEAASDIAIKLINKGFSEEAHNIASELIEKSANTTSTNDSLSASYAKKIADNFVQKDLPDKACSIANQLLEKDFSNLPKIIVESLYENEYDSHGNKILDILVDKLIKKDFVSDVVELAVNINDPELLRDTAIKLVNSEKSRSLTDDIFDFLSNAINKLAKSNKIDYAKSIVDSLFQKEYHHQAARILYQDIPDPLSSYIVDKLIDSGQHNMAKFVATFNNKNLKLSCDIAIKLIENNHKGALNIFDHILEEDTGPKRHFLEKIASKLVEFNHIDDAYSTYKKLNNVNYAYAKTTAKTIYNKIFYKVLNNAFGWLLPSFFINNQDTNPKPTPPLPADPINRI